MWWLQQLQDDIERREEEEMKKEQELIDIYETPIKEYIPVEPKKPKKKRIIGDASSTDYFKEGVVKILSQNMHARPIITKGDTLKPLHHMQEKWFTPTCDPGTNFENQQQIRSYIAAQKIRTMPQILQPQITCFQELQQWSVVEMTTGLMTPKLKLDVDLAYDYVDENGIASVDKEGKIQCEIVKPPLLSPPFLYHSSLCMKKETRKKFVESGPFQKTQENFSLSSERAGAITQLVDRKCLAVESYVDRLGKAVKIVQPGGILTYSRCPILYQEAFLFPEGTGGETMVNKGVVYSMVFLTQDVPELEEEEVKCVSVAGVYGARKKVFSSRQVTQRFNSKTCPPEEPGCCAAQTKDRGKRDLFETTAGGEKVTIETLSINGNDFEKTSTYSGVSEAHPWVQLPCSILWNDKKEIIPLKTLRKSYGASSRLVHVFNCHPLAPITMPLIPGIISGYGSCAGKMNNCTMLALRKVQLKQLRQIYFFKLGLEKDELIQPEELVIFCGDMNINRYTALWETPKMEAPSNEKGEGFPKDAMICCGEEFYTLLQQLQAEQPPLYRAPFPYTGSKGGLLTWDGGDNAIGASPLWDDSFTLIDYVLYSCCNAIPEYSANQVIRFKYKDPLHETGRFWNTDCEVYRTSRIEKLQKEKEKEKSEPDFTSAKAKELGNLIKSQKEIREDREKMEGNPRLKTQRGKEIERWESNKPEGFDALLSKGKPYHDVSDHYGILGTFINWSKSDKKTNRSIETINQWLPMKSCTSGGNIPGCVRTRKDKQGQVALRRLSPEGKSSEYQPSWKEGPLITPKRRGIGEQEQRGWKETIIPHGDKNVHFPPLEFKLGDYNQWQWEAAKMNPTAKKETEDYIVKTAKNKPYEAFFPHKMDLKKSFYAKGPKMAFNEVTYADKDYIESTSDANRSRPEGKHSRWHEPIDSADGSCMKCVDGYVPTFNVRGAEPNMNVIERKGCINVRGNLSCQNFKCTECYKDTRIINLDKLPLTFKNINQFILNENEEAKKQEKEKPFPNGIRIIVQKKGKREREYEYVWDDQSKKIKDEAWWEQKEEEERAHMRRLEEEEEKDYMLQTRM